MDGNDTYRTVVESPEFTRQTRVVGLEVSRLDEIREGVDWAVAKNPTSFHRIPNTNLYWVATRRIGSSPSLAIYYTIDDPDKITYRWIDVR